MVERQRLSAVILSKNEEGQIARCLQSVQWADEIIVVDGLSTDRTVDICRAYGATVISRAFSGSFGDERNAGNEAASGDWILQLDADDTVSPQLRAHIEDILRNGSTYSAYKFRRKNWFLGHEMRYGGWYHYYPHLFRRGQAHFEGRVHHLLKTDGPLGTLEGALEHRPFHSIEQFVAKHNRYTDLEAQEMLQQHGPGDPGLLRYQIMRRPLKLFWKLYMKKQGFREGWYGLIFSILFAWVHLLKWAKYWQVSTLGPQPYRSPLITDEDRPSKRLTRTRHVTLSVVLMTKNEEARIASCLANVYGWADEIVIIDDQSSDRTVDIARRFTDRIFSYPCEDNHDRQWNRGIDHAQSEWILHIDADGRVTPQLREAIDAALDRQPPYAAFELMRKNFFLGHPMQYGGWHHRHLILFRRTKAHCTGNGIHVQLAVDGSIGRLPAEIEHYPFDSLQQFIQRQNHYSTVEAHRMAARPSVPARRLLYQLTCRPIKLFWKSYVKQQGYREQFHGLVFGLLYAFMHTILWAKYWQLTRCDSDQTMQQAGLSAQLTSPSVSCAS